MENVYEELNARGLINQVTSENVIEALNKPQAAYCGFDPTGDSLHIGHLFPIVLLKHFENYGHTPIALIGGATGLIGDPSGKKEERVLNTKETVVAYSNAIEQQLKKYLNKDKALFVNNYDWFGKLSAIDFLRDYGKNFGVNYMINKDSVASRLEYGLSYTEFSYTIIQAMDFAHLYENHGCKIQVGGSDQWGNITSGLELIRKRGNEEEAFGITVPLVTKSDGTKFGKTAGGAIWLNPEKTSPYEFYQFFLNTDDSDVIKYLKTFTFLDIEEINRLENEVKINPKAREAQKVLACEITKFVHSEEALEEAKVISEVLFSGDLSKLSKEQIDANFKNIDMYEIDNDTSILEVLKVCSLAASNRESREFLGAGSIKINGSTIEEEINITKDMAIGDTYLLIKRGKKKFAFVKIK